MFSIQSWEWYQSCRPTLDKKTVKCQTFPWIVLHNTGLPGYAYSYFYLNLTLITQQQQQAINTQIDIHAIPKIPFVCSLIICETLWVSVNTFYGSTGTEALSSLSKWFYKQCTEAWCLLTWNPLPLSLTYCHWYNLFSGNCGTDQWFPWLILLLRLKMRSHSSKRVSHPCVYVLRTWTLQQTSRNSYIRKIQIKARVLCDSSFLQIFLVLAE